MKTFEEILAESIVKDKQIDKVAILKAFDAKKIKNIAHDIKDIKIENTKIAVCVIDDKELEVAIVISYNNDGRKFYAAVNYKFKTNTKSTTSINLLTYGESKKEAYDEVVEFKNNFRFNSHLI
jgi:hypothetical protein